MELDDQAQIISYEEYTPYGSTSYQAVRSQTETPKRHRYTGMERDEESGLAYHSARYCLPWLGRWSSCDPLGSVADLNLYEYCRSRPIVLLDPAGEQPKDEDVSGASKTKEDESKRALPTGASALGVWDAGHRVKYKVKSKTNSAAGAKKVKAAIATGNTQEAADIARDTSLERNKVRLDTRAKSTPGGRAAAEALDKPRLWKDLTDKYGDPYENPAAAEKIARAAGRSRLSSTFFPACLE